jgi:polysaccharide biosynthesis/export protein
MNQKKHLIHSISRFSLFVFISLLGFSSVYAQSVDELSDDQIQQFMKQAQESGMSEDQLMAAAAAKGFGSADISKFKDRMTKLQADKKGPVNINTTDTERRLNDTTSTKIVKQPIKEDSSAIRREKYYGLNLFNNKKIVFEPNLRIPTPKNYVLGTGDELNISITGFAAQTYKVKVSPEGTVQLDILSPIYVSGLTIEQASERIINRLKSRFAGLNSSGGGLYADITLGNIRSISVTVIGEALQPGTFTIPSLANVFNVLYACGGPSEIGSLRNIEVFRNGKVIRTLDVYDFLLHGDQKDNIILQDQDIIRIPYVDTRVSLLGEVRNPKIFEVKRGEKLKDVLAFAGGFKEFSLFKNNFIRKSYTHRKTHR